MKTKDHVIDAIRKTREKLWKTAITSPCRYKTKVKIGRVTKRGAREALKHFDKLREIIARRPSPFQGMSEEEVIKSLRQTREKLWEKKIGISA